MLNSIYRGGWRWSHGALDIQGVGFLLRIGIWPGVDVGTGNMGGKILHPYSILSRAGVDPGVFCHAPAVGSVRKNTGGEFRMATGRV